MWLQEGNATCYCPTWPAFLAFLLFLSVLTRPQFCLPWTRGSTGPWLEVQSLELEYKAPNLMLTLCQHILTMWPWTVRAGARLSYPIHRTGVMMVCAIIQRLVGGPHEVIYKEFLESSCPPAPRTTVFDRCELSGVPVCLLRPSPSWAPQLFTHPSWCFSDPLVKIMALSSPLWEHSVFTLTLLWVWLDQGRGASASPSMWSSWRAAFSFFFLKNTF